MGGCHSILKHLEYVVVFKIFMCDVIYVLSMNKTVSVESESEPTQDLELVFHQSRISNADEEIRIEPVELVATYDTSPVDDVDPDDVFVVDSPQKIPFSSRERVVQLENDIDGDDTQVKEIDPTHYIRFTSEDLLTDIYVPIEKRFHSDKIRWLGHFIGDQSNNTSFTPQIDTFETTYTRAKINESKIEIFNERDISTETREKLWMKPFNLLDNELVNSATKFTSVMIFFLSFVYGISGIENMLSPNGPTPRVPFVPDPTLSTYITLAAGLAVCGGVLFLLSRLYAEENSETFPYTLNRPNDAVSVFSIDDMGDDVGEIINATAHIEDGACIIERVDGEGSWEVSLTNGVMSEQVVDFFERVGAEQITEEFTVRKRPSPTDQTIAADKRTVFFEPAQ